MDLKNCLIFILCILGNDPEKQKIFRKIAEEVSGMTRLLDQFEKCVAEERDSLKQLEVCTIEVVLYASTIPKQKNSEDKEGMGRPQRK